MKSKSHMHTSCQTLCLCQRIAAFGLQKPNAPVVTMVGALCIRKVYQFALSDKQLQSLLTVQRPALQQLTGVYEVKLQDCLYHLLKTAFAHAELPTQKCHKLVLAWSKFCTADLSTSQLT